MGDISVSLNVDIYTLLAYLMVLALSLTIAFAGYKLLRLEIALYAAFIGFTLGHNYLGLYLGDLLIPGQTESVRIALGVLLALTLTILAFKYYKAVLIVDLAYSFIVTALYALIDGYVTELIIIAVIYALLILTVCKFLRKTVILLTSYVGSLLSVCIIGLGLRLGDALLGPQLLILPLIIAVFAAKVQFSTTEDDED